MLAGSGSVLPGTSISCLTSGKVKDFFQSSRLGYGAQGCGVI